MEIKRSVWGRCQAESTFMAMESRAQPPISDCTENGLGIKVK